MTQFSDFFEALWKGESWPQPAPFPWQTMVALRAASGDWPEVINLPTASGKTACLDAAIFGLAATSDAPAEMRMPRRIWFVVDRRIVVDEAFERARKIARKLVDATEGPVQEVADRLRHLSGTNWPLAVARLRGGVWRDDEGWARLPSQPAIICSTVDQVGSALLFRAYGHSDRTASIYAGLTAHDSLIVLDEAHCAVPFLQTLRAVAHFRDERWATQALRTPFRFSIMSATPPSGIAEEATFPRPTERAVALDHPVLQKRLTARKLAVLLEPVKDDTEFFDEAVRRARAFAKPKVATGSAAGSSNSGKRRVAIMVNRVATAEQIAERLRIELGDNIDVALLTGRMRPLDRDTLVKKWDKWLKAGSTEPLDKTVIVVTTQCLEVGADFSFDALVTECASLDALRQRFGRLDRLGTLGESPAAILIREKDTQEPGDEEADPIYGKAIYETWKWLNELSQDSGDRIANFGVEPMDALVNALREQDPKRFEQLLAPATDAPILLPAHLDLFSQTSPHPVPEPDVTLFLHGKKRGQPEVQVVVRTDLPDPASMSKADDVWLDILSLLPPTSPEMLTVPLHRLRRWLVQGVPDDGSDDVEGARAPAEHESERSRQNARVSFLCWRGRSHSEFTNDVGRVRPNDIVVLRLNGQGLRGIGQSVEQADGLGAERLDLAEAALRQARARVVLRIQHDVLHPFLAHRSVKQLLELASEPEPDRTEIEAALEAVRDDNAVTKGVIDEPAMPALPEWLKETVGFLSADGFRMEDHPAGGLILIGKERRPIPDGAEMEDDPVADEEDFASQSGKPVTLQDHAADVCRVASEFVPRCLPPQLQDVFSLVAKTHDLGKLDPRFQILLRGGVEDEVETSPPLAKSPALPDRRRSNLEIREDAGLPQGFRHEFLSMQLVEHFGLTPNDETARDLVLHLIASHHGYARPFAPVVPDPMVIGGRVEDLSLDKIGIDATLAAAERRAFPPAHRLDSGVADRFWRLTRCYGWWGLAYLEAIFRLSDWQASREPETTRAAVPAFAAVASRASSQTAYTLMLDALDGANPLAFLAALGTLRVLSRVFPVHDLRLSWEQRLGAWRPLLWANRAVDKASLLSALHENGLKLNTMFSPRLLAASEAASPKNKKGEARWKDKLLFPINDFRQFCATASASPSALVEFAATWAGETVTAGEQGGELARRTRFDFTAGQQAFIKMLSELRSTCTAEDLCRSLFTGWRYSATAVSMRWDTQDEKRQYALQAVDPTNGSKNPPLADAGANFLAVEALPLFPVVPDQWASQPGFDRDGEGRRWHWAIWTCPIGLEAIRSLLALPLADSEEWPPSLRRALGMATVFQSTIVQPSGRYRCFTPARSL